MGTTRKVLKKVAVVVESSARTYKAPTTRIPYTTFTVNSEYDMIADESIEGVAASDLPNQGNKKVEGQLAGIVDVLTIAPILEAAFGAEAGGVYTLPVTENTKTLSIVAKDEVKTYKYAGAVIKSIRFRSETGGRLTFEADVIAYTESRDDTAFPEISIEKGTRLIHTHAGGTGYLYIGDQDDALATGDRQGLSRVEFGFEWGFDHDHDNTAQTTLIPLSTANPANLSFQDSRSDTDAYHAWRDARTALQAAFYYYASATATLLFEIPNFVITQAAHTEDDVGRIDCVAAVGRNGIGSSYSNANMEFVSPIRATLVNS